jgi:hypothetical protein
LEADVFFAAKQKPQTLWAAARSKCLILFDKSEKRTTPAGRW